MSLPYKAHPLYHLRRLLIIISLIGITLALISLEPYAPSDGLIMPLLLCTSALIAGADLLFYATRKAARPGEDPPWPTIPWMAADVVLAVLLLGMATAVLNTLTIVYGYRSGSFVVLSAYAALACLLNSGLHFYCLWKQLIARYKARWLMKLAHEPCARCGYEQLPDNSDMHAPMPTVAATHRPLRTQAPQNTFTYAGPSASFPKAAKILTPQSPDSSMEEGLLIGSDHGSGYGSISPAEPTLEQPAEVLVGSKGKKSAGRR